MPQAKITINAVVGSDGDLPINTVVQLDNQNSGGELTYTWSILDQPPGAVDALSSVSAQNPFFTPKKEGTYLIRLIVNQGLASEQEDRVVAAVLQLKTLARIPAAGETTELDTSDGWATASNDYLRRVDTLLGDPGVFVGVNASGGTLVRGEVLRAVSSWVIKTGLPGQETLPGFTKALATTLTQVDEPLVVCEGTVAGAGSAASGELIKARFLGRYAGNSVGAPAVGDPIYVSDTGTMSPTPGTVRRQIGSAMTAGAPYDIWFAGVGGADITPIDRRYVVHGPPGTLPNGVRVDGTNATGLTTPFRIKAGDAATVALQVQAFAAGQDIQQWLSPGGSVLASVMNSGQFYMAVGLQVASGNIDVLAGDITLSGTLTAGGDLVGDIVQANGAQFAGSVNVTAGNITFSTGTQRLRWTAMGFQEGGTADSITLRKLATGEIYFEFSQAGSQGLERIWGGGTLYLNLGTSGGSEGQVYTSGAFDLGLGTNGTIRWYLRNSGVFESNGGPFRITGVANPTADLDAINRRWAQWTLATKDNLLINGAFDFWQRGTPRTALIAAAGNTRLYGPDRWVLYAERGVGAGTSAIVSTRTANTLSNSEYMARQSLNVPTAGTSFVLRWQQEFDRDFVVRARGKKVTFAFRTSSGGGWVNPLHMEVRTGTGAKSETLETGYTGSSTIHSENLTLTGGIDVWTKTTSSIVPTNATTMVVYFSVDSTANATMPTGAFADMADVMAVAGEAAPLEFDRAGRDIAGEQELCERFYEKSYNRDVAPATNTNVGQHVVQVGSEPGATVGGAPNVRYRVAKAPYTSGGAAVTVYTPGGTAGSVQAPAGNVAATVSNSAEGGFQVADGGAFPAEGANLFLQWTADWEI